MNMFIQDQWHPSHLMFHISTKSQEGKSMLMSYVSRKNLVGGRLIDKR